MQPEAKQQSDRIEFIVQHMEEYLYEWCLYEYLQIQQYLKNRNCVLRIFNAKTFLQYKGQHQEENNKNIALLQESFNHPDTQLILESLTSQQNTKLLLPTETCLLDMRSQKQLSPGQTWKRVVFGGILGDHPPRDRSKPLRDITHEIRHLGQLQLATDTAVLVTRLILKNRIKLADIPMVKQPTLKGLNKKGEITKVQMEGFSYVSKQLDIETGKIQTEMSKKDKKKVYIHQGVQKLLLSEDLDAQKLM